MMRGHDPTDLEGLSPDLRVTLHTKPVVIFIMLPRQNRNPYRAVYAVTWVYSMLSLLSLSMMFVRSRMWHAIPQASGKSGVDDPLHILALA